MAKHAGRPPHLPTAQQRLQVEILAASGWNQEQVARFFGLAPTTLRKCYKNELSTGKDKMGMMLSLTLFQLALKGKMPALFFALKTQFGWRENVGIQPLGKNGEPIDLNKLDTASLEQVLAALTATGAGGTGPALAGAAED